MSPASTFEPRSAAATGGPCRPASAGARAFTVLALSAVFAAMLALSAGASARSFTVEIIVFDDLGGEDLHTEHWPADPGEPSLQGAIELVHSPAGEAGEASRAYRLVDRSALALGGVWRALRRSARYRPFLHVGWRVPGLSHGAARPVHVSPHLDVRRTGGPGPEGGGRPAVEGTVKVSLARYLHVELDLVYSRPSQPGNGGTAAQDTAPASFRLVSERRMRSNELHYVDHPLFGVLALIQPL